MTDGADLIAIVRPGGPLHVAALDVEGEVLDVYVAGAAVDAVTQPHHFPVTADYHVGVDHGRAILRVSTKQTLQISKKEFNLVCNELQCVPSHHTHFNF